MIVCGCRLNILVIVCVMVLLDILLVLNVLM